jgi:soluble lytic murein transglycosylase
MAVMWRENSFNPAAGSEPGTCGLVRVMPHATQAVGRQRGRPTVWSAPPSGISQNLRVGPTYSTGLATHFDNHLSLAAAYNVGPHHVIERLAQNRNPCSAPINLSDWIDPILFSEARNCVQHVVQLTPVCQGLLDESAPAFSNVP